MERNKDCIYEPYCDNECHSMCIRYLETKYLLDASNIPKSKQKVNTLYPDTCDINSFSMLSDIREDIKEFVRCGSNLYIYSSTCGNGKTTWAIKIMLQYFNEMWAGNGFTERGIFINVPYTGNIKPEQLSNYVGERLASRIANNSILIELKGRDMRNGTTPITE